MLTGRAPLSSGKLVLTAFVTLAIVFVVTPMPYFRNEQPGFRNIRSPPPQASPPTLVSTLTYKTSLSPADSGLLLDTPYATVFDFPYNYSLSSEQRRRGLVSLGDGARLRNFVRSLSRGDAVHVAFVGGSITRGTGSTGYGRIDYVSLFSDFISSLSPKAIFTNAGAGGTTNAYMALCLRHLLPSSPRPDLVVVELGINGEASPHSEEQRAHERLIRQLLQYTPDPSAPPPAVLYVIHSMMILWDADEVDRRITFLRGNADALSQVAQWYALPWATMRSALWRDLVVDSPHWTPEQLLHPDYAHPRDLGHAAMADLLAEAVQATARELGGLRPWDAVDESLLAAPLPPPLFPENDSEGGNGWCRAEAELLPLLVREETRGFAYVNEGVAENNPKWGWVGEHVDDTLTIRFDTNADGRPGPAFPRETRVGWIFLRSHDLFGTAQVRCREGCTCDSKLLHGGGELHVSETVTHLHTVKATHDACKISITIVSKDKTKFKLIGFSAREASPPPKPLNVVAEESESSERPVAAS